MRITIIARTVSDVYISINKKRKDGKVLYDMKYNRRNFNDEKNIN